MDINSNESQMENSHVHQGKNVKSARRLRDIGQRDLGKLLGMSQQDVSELEKMKTIPEETLMQVAQVLNVSLGFLKTNDDDCKICIEGDINASDSAQVLVTEQNENQIQTQTQNNYADKALEVIETVVNNQNNYVDYLKTEIVEQKKEINLLRLEIKGLLEQMKK